MMVTLIVFFVVFIEKFFEFLKHLTNDTVFIIATTWIDIFEFFICFIVSAFLQGYSGFGDRADDYRIYGVCL